MSWFSLLFSFICCVHFFFYLWHLWERIKRGRWNGFIIHITDFDFFFFFFKYNFEFYLFVCKKHSNLVNALYPPHNMFLFYFCWCVIVMYISCFSYSKCIRLTNGVDVVCGYLSEIHHAFYRTKWKFKQMSWFRTDF